MRTLFWFGLYLLSLCSLDIDVEYDDGLHINLKNAWRRGEKEGE